MAFDRTYFGRTDNSFNNAPQSWSYSHPTDTLANQQAAGYFGAVSDLVKVGDTIIMQDSTNARNFGKVTAVTAGAVTITASATNL